MKRIVQKKTESATENIDTFAEKEFQRGDAVLAKTVGGKWVNRRVWSANSGVVFLCSEQLFEDLNRGRSVLWPIAFPASDVKPAR